MLSPPPSWRTGSRPDGLVFVAGIIGSPGMSLADLATVDAERDGHLDKGDLEFDKRSLPIQPGRGDASSLPRLRP